MERVLPALRTAKQKAVRTHRPLALGHVHKVLWACLLVISHSSCSSSTVSGALEVYKPVEFVPDTEDYQFSHMVVDETSGSMYIGGKNWLYHINADMTLQRVQSTLPDGSECVKPCENFNKILAVIPGDVKQLVTCDSLTRKCQLRSLTNISESVEYDQVVVNPETPAVGIYSPNDAFFVAVSPQYTGIDNSLSYITKRQLQPAPFESLIYVDGQSTMADVHAFQLNFINGFNHGDFTYFITNQQQLVRDGYITDPAKGHPYVSKVNRVCHNSDTLDTFTEVPISCSVNGDSTTYNLIQAFEVSVPGKQVGDSFNNSGGALMYALFAQSEGNSDIPSSESALCIYDLAKLEQKFRDTVELCLTGGEAYESTHVQGSNCLSIASVTPESLDGSLCETTFFKFPSALEPLAAEAVLVLDGAVATSIASGIEEEHTVLFIGTNAGNLIKAHVTNSTHVRKYEEVKISTSQVQQDNFFDATNDELYLLTDRKVVRLAVTNCNQYTTCDECIGVDGALDGDPYCGWCSLEARCSRYRDCRRMNGSVRWLSYDSEQCIRITNTSLGHSLFNLSLEQEKIIVEVIEAGQDAVLTCVPDAGTSNFYAWNDESGVTPVRVVTNGWDINADPKYSNFASSPSGDELTITAATVEDEGKYRCITDAGTSPGYALTVEVGSTLTLMFATNPLIAGTEITATCDVIGSRPQLDIAWTLNDIALDVTPVVTNPTNTDPDLSDTRSEVTLTPTPAMNGQDLKCTTSGHVVTSLNSEATTQLSVQYAPTSETATIVVVPTKEGDYQLRVTCQVSAVVDGVEPANPPVTDFTIYTGSEQMRFCTSGVNYILVDIPENATDYKCSSSNDLGTIESGSVTYDPGQLFTSGPGSTTTFTGGAVPWSGAIAGMVVLAVLFTISVCINVVLFVLWRRGRNTQGQPANKGEKIRVRDTAKEGNDTEAYEMVQSTGNAAYTSLNLAKQSVVSPPAEDVSFFSRLGSIGRGEFGAMWTGALRSKQGQLPVAIRSVPDHVIKSANIDQSSKILSKLPHHPNVVTCIGYCVGKASLLYELIPGGSLLTHLQTSGGQSAPTYSNLKSTRVNLEESNLLKLAWQVAKGMDFLASRKITHGTLCAHNVLMTENKQCKISDYGLASVYGINIKPTRWSSPETMMSSACSLKGDIWSYGIVLWEIVTLGAMPYPKMTFDIVQREVTQGYKMSRPQHCGQELFAIMNACWENNPQNRSSFQQILKKLEHLMEKDHVYLEPSKLDERFYESAN